MRLQELANGKVLFKCAKWCPFLAFPNLPWPFSGAVFSCFNTGLFTWEVKASDYCLLFQAKAMLLLAKLSFLDRERSAIRSAYLGYFPFFVWHSTSTQIGSAFHSLTDKCLTFHSAMNCALLLSLKVYLKGLWIMYYSGKWWQTHGVDNN